MANPDDPLYCFEDNFDGEVLDFEQEEICSFNKDENFAPILYQHDLYWEDDELSSLLTKQERNQLCKKLESNPSMAEYRIQAVNWMLKVNAHYSFTVLTSVLAVDFLDRFLFNFPLEQKKPWMIQLVTVACLSLAAKVEETQVPLLLDLQVEDSKYVFEAKTIQRMELLVLSTLQWRMNPVTPLSFLDYFARRLGLEDWELVKRCELTVLSLISDCRSLAYLPSVIAAATMLHNLGPEYENQLLGFVGNDKERVNDCRKLIMELASGDYYSGQPNKRKLGSVPGSPNCVMDLSFSSDCSNDSWSVGSSVSSSPERPPPAKKSRGVSGKNAESFLSIHR